MRLYAFGHPDLIISLGTVKTPKDVLEARIAYKKSTGLGVNSLPAYGNVRFNPKHIPGHIEKIFNIVPELFARICEENKMGGSVILFKRMIELIGEAGIPFHSPGSIFQWLLACDLAELDGIVAPPTARDLAKRVERSVREKKGGSGTWGGLIKDIEEHHWPEATEDVLTDHLERIYHGVREGLKTQENIFHTLDVLKAQWVNINNRQRKQRIDVFTMSWRIMNKATSVIAADSQVSLSSRKVSIGWLVTSHLRWVTAVDRQRIGRIKGDDISSQFLPELTLHASKGGGQHAAQRQAAPTAAVCISSYNIYGMCTPESWLDNFDCVCCGIRWELSDIVDAVLLS
ncbi:hypothetical protein P167DRAFT_548475 [Morchella conica CCBAS932]|uniref:Uncharacterized protein n=1 Tax=Morchella conica CCBAS932 TaxID=1392247 RepID=A0A3N4KHJ8_9PEZI|nr:hypothetical protein P167DRAFT_548475 [Morchella conica CCBAS932]